MPRGSQNNPDWPETDYQGLLPAEQAGLPLTTKFYKGWRLSYIKDQEGVHAHRRNYLHAQADAQLPGAAKLPVGTRFRPMGEIIEAAETQRKKGWCRWNSTGGEHPLAWPTEK